MDIYTYLGTALLHTIILDFALLALEFFIFFWHMYIYMYIVYVNLFSYLFSICTVTYFSDMHAYNYNFLYLVKF